MVMESKKVVLEWVLAQVLLLQVLKKTNILLEVFSIKLFTLILLFSGTSINSELSANTSWPIIHPSVLANS
jgi:uncharacterized membrane protein YgdD (TMEM256/DUF423 family)